MGIRRMKLTLDGARLEAELILFGDTGHGSVAEFARPSNDATAAAGRGARDVEVRSGNLQLDIRDEELALGTLQDGDFLLLDDVGNGCR